MSKTVLASPVPTAAVAIRNEAEKKLKKSSWRYMTIKEFLPDSIEEEPAIKYSEKKIKGSSLRYMTIKEYKTDSTTEKTEPGYSVDNVVEAAKILDGHQDNIYRRLENISSGLSILTYLVFLALGIWLVVAPTRFDEFFSIREVMITPLVFWISIYLFGFMGAIFSGYIFSRRQNLKTEIPYQLLGLTLTFARLGVGCLSALIVTIFLFAKFINFGQIRYETVLALAFVAGFSEQFVLRMVQAIAEPA